MFSWLVISVSPARVQALVYFLFSSLHGGGDVAFKEWIASCPVLRLPLLRELRKRKRLEANKEHRRALGPDDLAQLVE